MKELKNISISELVVNNGQIEGVPKNPRFIRDERYEKLKQSISDSPEMLDYRRLAVYPYDGKYVVLCGNMRLRACKELGYKEMPCYVLSDKLDSAKLREWIIKDNEAFGQNDWDILANEWDTEELQNWGMDCSFLGGADDTDIDDLFDTEQKKEKEDAYKLIVTVPDEYADDRVKIGELIRDAISKYPNISVK